MSVLDQLLPDRLTGWTVIRVDVGKNWVLSQVEHTDGRRQAGVATAPREFADDAQYLIGRYQPASDALRIIHGLYHDDPSTVAVALATYNAVQNLSEADITTVDAADWLSEQSKGRTIAIFGRFPFIQDEIRPFAKQVFVFEQSPQADEYAADDMPHILPQADIVAITGSTIVNHTIDGILHYITPQQTVAVLGPSTPITPQLFTLGISALFGVRVIDAEAVQASVHDHLGFQKVQGLQRIALFR